MFLVILLVIAAILALVWCYYNVKNVTVFYYIFGIFVVFMIVYSFIKSNYYHGLKNISIEKIIKEYDQTFDYSPFGEFTRDEYYECKFGAGVISSFDDFVKKNNGLRLSHVQVGSARKESYDVAFSGIFASIPIKNIQCKIIFDIPGLILLDYKKYVSKNEEFNKALSVYTDNLSRAEKVLTPELMEELISVKKETLFDVEIRIFNDILYMRFATGAGILASPFNAKQERESVYSYIGTLDYVSKIVEKTKDCIDKINF